MPQKRYLVTGGTGFIGSAIVKRLVKEGNFVRVLDNDSRGSMKRLKDVSEDIEYMCEDIRDQKAVDKACKDIDSVIHLAFINGTEFFYSKPELVLDVGVKGILNIVDCCLSNNIKELFLASSSEVYQTPPAVPTDENVPLLIPDPFNPRYSYGGGKIISELIAINYGRKNFDRVCIFRPHNVYGPDMGWEHVIPQFILRMKEITEKEDKETIDFPIQGSGKETRAFVYIDDFVDGFIKILEKGKNMEIFNIGTMDEISIKDLAIEIGKCFGKKINIISNKLKEGGTLRRCPEIRKLKSLGYLPKINLSKGLKTTYDWYVKNSDKR